MICRRIPGAFLLYFLLISACVAAQKTDALPRSVPEAEGVSSKSIIGFLAAAGKSKHEMHSFMFLRHGKVIAEGWWNPYQPTLKHTMYSVSKSFTSTAVGFAVTEKKLSVNDKVISFFKESLPDTISPYMESMTVKDLLTMSAGQEPDPTFTTVTGDSNWVKSFLSTPVLHKPGTVFLYNTVATFMLSAIVQKVTGERVIDYLGPRLFKPLGIAGMDWEISPQNINTGGWGLRVKTEDMAKLGQLFLQKGNWKGSRVLSEEWIEEATSGKILQTPVGDTSRSKIDSSDWLQGYGYQFWRSRNKAYRADGAFGQFIIVMPEQDAVIVMTAETPDMQGEINLVWDYLLPSFHTGKLPADRKMALALKQKLSSLSLPLPPKTAASRQVSHISERLFKMEPNEKQVSNVSFRFTKGVCRLTLDMDTANYLLSFGSGTWVRGETTRRGPYLLSKAKANYVGLPPLKVAGNYRWTDENTLELVLRYVESPHTETMLCHFNHDKVSIDFRNSADAWTSQLTILGKASH